MIYETVIGLEVHVELSTASKIFCGCPTNFWPVAQHPVLPCLQRTARRAAGLESQRCRLRATSLPGTNCEISRVTRFDRKNYFYPDLPKAYQISQLHQPIGRDGHLAIATAEGEKRSGSMKSTWKKMRKIDPRPLGGLHAR